jgi:hypothetical protein
MANVGPALIVGPNNPIVPLPSDDELGRFAALKPHG